jgi:two-component sensor histidine kinase
MTDRSANEASPRRQAVLVIDDDERNLAILSEYLKDIDLTILVAEDGESGLARAHYARPDLILLDVLLPGMDGYGICRRLKADPTTADIPIIFMTALTEIEFKVKGFEAGGVDYVTKPFQREEVLARVGVHIRIATLTQNLREANDLLEQRVEERTLELAAANRALAIDIERRVRDEEHLRGLLEEKSALLREIHHRVKNNLQVIASILNLQANYVSDPTAIEMFKRCQGRIASMALVHEELYYSQDLASIDFRSYVDELLAGKGQSSVDGGAIEFSNEVSGVRLPIESAVPCGLVLDELVTNALQHAFPSGWEGKHCLTIAMESVRGHNTLVVADTGIGLPVGFDPAGAKTFGMQLACTAVQQLRGTIAVEPGPGARFKIEFPGESGLEY